RTISVSSGGPFQWQKNGIDIQGAISNNYSVTATGTYKVKVGSGTCAATSNEVTYQVGNTFIPDLSSYGSESCSTNANSVQLNGPSGNQYSYQWSQDGVDIAGATQYYL